LQRKEVNWQNQKSLHSFNKITDNVRAAWYNTCNLLGGASVMNFLEERIMKDGIVKPGNVLKVDSFLNHQMDIALMEEIGKEFKRRFAARISLRC
jgi:hypothetical protein